MIKKHVIINKVSVKDLNNNLCRNINAFLGFIVIAIYNIYETLKDVFCFILLTKILLPIVVHIMRMVLL